MTMLRDRIPGEYLHIRHLQSTKQLLHSANRKPSSPYATSRPKNLSSLSQIFFKGRLAQALSICGAPTEIAFKIQRACAWTWAIMGRTVLSSRQSPTLPFPPLSSHLPLKRLVISLSEVFHCVILISNGNGRARIGQAECRARTVFKIDFELGLGLMNGFYFAA